MYRKELSSVDVAAIVRELKETILDSRVSNLYQIDPKTILLKLHKPDTVPSNLLIEAGKRIFLTSYTHEKPSTPPAFCMALRKYLRDARLKEVEQYEFERVITFKFVSKESVLRLILEFFGDGNIILIDNENVILQALTYKRMRDRNLLRGEEFIFAPSSGKNPLKIDRDNLSKGLRDYGDMEAIRALARFLSIGGFYSEEILLRTEVEKTKKGNLLEETEISGIFESLQDMLFQLGKGKLEPCIVLKNEEFLDVTPLPLKRYETSEFRFRHFQNFNQALDEFYIQSETVEKTSSRPDDEGLEKELERLGRMAQNQKDGLAEAEKRANHDKRIGDLIYAHMNGVQELLTRFGYTKDNRKSWKEIANEIMNEQKTSVEHHVFLESLDPKVSLVNLRIGDASFSMDIRKNLFGNAAVYYEKSKKAKQKLEGSKAALRGTLEQMDRLKTKIGETRKLRERTPSQLEEETAKRKIKPKEWYEKFRWFVSSDGFLIVAGKDAVSNEVLIKKHTEPDDIVFHADIIGAPFAIIKTQGKQATEQTLNETAEFAAAFSRAWREGFASVDTYWVKPQQLSKGGPSGESVPHGGFVVRGERHWFKGTVLRQSIGAIISGKEVGFIGGPANAIKAKTNYVVAIIPGDIAGRELARQILHALSQNATQKAIDQTARTSIEEIRELIPYNKGRLEKTALHR